MCNRTVNWNVIPNCNRSSPQCVLQSSMDNYFKYHPYHRCQKQNVYLRLYMNNSVRRQRDTAHSLVHGSVLIKERSRIVCSIANTVFTCFQSGLGGVVEIAPQTQQGGSGACSGGGIESAKSVVGALRQGGVRLGAELGGAGTYPRLLHAPALKVTSIIQ